MDAELVRRRMAESRAEAQRLIAEGAVAVAGVVTPKAATMVTPDAVVELARPPRRFVSRGGDKLEHALEVFAIEVAGKRAVDLGASTGGFTDCLLQRDVAQVTAVDVGYNQRDYRLRNHPRVVVMERTNARTLQTGDVEGPFDVVVGDLSFISLELVMGTIAALATDEADIVVLVKPQFEVGKEQVGRGGLVSEPELWRQAITRITMAGAGHGLGSRGLTASPLRGASAGNREFLLWLAHGPFMLSAKALDEALVDDAEGVAS
ncbi:MAG: TlyA family RNA methyltransferase [Acidimicrobiia bacterium]